MPPPPPPPGAPPPPAAPSLPSGKKGTSKTDRKDLLKDIHRGTRLKPTQTNDRSSPLIGHVKSSNTSSANSPVVDSLGRTEGSSSQNVAGPLPGIGGLFSGGIPTLKKTKGGIDTGRNAEAESRTALSTSNPSKIPSSSISSSLNSSPSLSPSPSPVSSTPTHAKAPPPPTNKPSVPNAKPTIINPRPSTSSPGLVHPSSKPPPPPPNTKLAATTHLSRTTISKSFNQTIGHGRQERPQIPHYGQRASKDDTSIRNGQIGMAAPPPPVRTVSQTQINSGRLPTRAPPPPPPLHKRPSQPPPPPPSQPSLQAPVLQPPNKALPPPPPISIVNNDPPTPPTRRESIHRTGPNSSGYNSSASSNGDNFESRFASRFRTIQYLPPPEPFSGCQKTYPSKNTLPARQGSQIKRTPAPPPPPGKAAPPSAPPPPPYKTDVTTAPGKPPLPPMRQWSTTTTGVL